MASAVSCVLVETCPQFLPQFPAEVNAQILSFFSNREIEALGCNELYTQLFLSQANVINRSESFERQLEEHRRQRLQEKMRAFDAVNAEAHKWLEVFAKIRKQFAAINDSLVIRANEVKHNPQLAESISAISQGVREGDHEATAESWGFQFRVQVGIKAAADRAKLFEKSDALDGLIGELQREIHGMFHAKKIWAKRINEFDMAVSSICQKV